VLHDRLFRALNDSGCPYVVVGGLAAVLHGVSRLTHDVDLVVELRTESARQVIDALDRIGYQPQVPVRARDFANADQRRAWIRDKGMQVFSLWDPDHVLPTVDLFVQYPIDFDELLAASDLVELGEYSVRIASTRHLIEMKKKAGRSHDLEDIRALQRLQEKP
jgi:predicted nucleotidyltransferase